VFEQLDHTGQEIVHKIGVGIGWWIEKRRELCTDCAETSVLVSDFAQYLKFVCHLSTLISKYITLCNLLLLFSPSLFTVLLGAMIIHQCHDRVGDALHILTFLSYTDFEMFGFVATRDHEIFAC
jgi:hypothetical protein